MNEPSLLSGEFRRVSQKIRYKKNDVSAKDFTEKKGLLVL